MKDKDRKGGIGREERGKKNKKRVKGNRRRTEREEIELLKLGSGGDWKG